MGPSFKFIVFCSVHALNWEQTGLYHVFSLDIRSVMDMLTKCLNSVERLKLLDKLYYVVCCAIFVGKPV